MASSATIPHKYRPVGVALAIGSGLLIGSSFVFKKQGLLSSQKGHVAGEGVAYLKSPLWWTGMTIMILGEICNLIAYSFLEAIIVTPMGALSVVISAMLSHVVLKEKLSLFGWISCLQCILGATILALNGPEQQSVSTILEFKKLFLAPGFLSYGAVVIAAAVVLAFFVAPRWGKNSMMPYIGICSLIGGLSVSCTQGLGACIVTSIRAENQFTKSWFIYFLLGFVIITLLTEIYYLNIALALFNTAMVTPTYYVTFTACVLVTSVILYQGLKASATKIMTVVLGFLVICTGIFILQMSKVDPRDLKLVDRRTSLLLHAARVEIDPKSARELERASTGRSERRGPSTHSRTWNNVGRADIEANVDETSDVDENDIRSVIEKTEDPGMDSLRGTFGTFGTIIRARRRATVLSQARSRSSSGLSGSRSELIMAMSQKREGDVEKTGIQREALARAATATGTTQEARPSIRFAGSAPATFERSEVEMDPMEQLEDVVPTRAQTLPTVLPGQKSMEIQPIHVSTDESKR